jgi:hypothetical protein
MVLSIQQRGWVCDIILERNINALFILGMKGLLYQKALKNKRFQGFCGFYTEGVLLC